MADGVHPSVQGVEAAGLQAVPDRVRRNAGFEQLRTCDNAVLTLGEPCDHPVRGKWDGLWGPSTYKPSHLAHDPDGADETATELAPSVPKFARTLDKRRTLFNHHVKCPPTS